MYTYIINTLTAGLQIYCT